MDTLDAISIFIQIVSCILSHQKEIKQILDSSRKKRIYGKRQVLKASVSVKTLKDLKYVVESGYGSRFNYYRQCELHQHLYGKINTNEETREGALLYHAHFSSYG